MQIRKKKKTCKRRRASTHVVPVSYSGNGQLLKLLTILIKSPLKCRIDRQLLSSFTLYLCEMGLHTTFWVSNG